MKWVSIYLLYVVASFNLKWRCSIKKPVKAECRYLVMVRASFDHDDHSRVWIQAKLVERATDMHEWTRWYAPSKERGKVQELFKLIDDRVSHNTTNKE